MRWLRKGRIRFLRGQRGIGLLETIIAVAILGLIGTSILTALNTNAKATRTLDEHVVATNLATAYIEAIKAMDYYTNVQDYLDNEKVTSITIPPQYIVNVDIQFTDDPIPDDENGIVWDYDPVGKTLQKLTVTVSREGGEHVLTICAFKTKRQEG
jgi:type II secretory pathway pseudopilin PulG